MSYPKDLDEYSEKAIRAELDRREKQRSKGLCDYCARPPDTAPCMYPDRHRRAK